MALRSYSIPNLSQGISQQPDAQRDPSQGEIQINGMSSIVEGLRKRDSSEVLAEVSSTSFGDCFIHSILRDNTEEYIAVISSSDVKVYDLEGNAKIVRKSGVSYLSTVTDARQDIRAVTIADYTFITNRKKIPAMKTATAPATARPTAHEALVWIKGASYGNRYKLTVNGSSAQVDTPVAAVVSSGGSVTENRISSEDIAENLRTNISASGVTITRSGSVLHLTSASAITLEATDAKANQDIGIFLHEVQAFTELPTIAPVGYQISIIGDPGNDFDGYYVEFQPKSGTFGEGSWTETVSPGVEYEVDENTMPHILVRLSNGQFYFGPADGSVMQGGAVTGVSVVTSPPVPTDLPLGGVYDEGPDTLSTDGSGVGLVLKQLKISYASGTHPPLHHDSNIVLHDVNNANGYDGYGYAVGDKIYIEEGRLFQAANTTGPATSTNPIHIATITSVSSPEIKVPTWGKRIAGDYNTAPDPSFIGFAINDIFIYKNRLGFLSDENVVLSRVRSFFEFFPETATTILDTDPIDVVASNNKVSVLKYAVPYQDELILFSSQYQFRFNAAETILTPKTAQITVLTQFEVDVNVRPQLAGGGIIFTQANGDWSQFREFSVRGAGTALTADAADLSGYVSAYVPSQIFKLTVNDTSNVMFGISGKAGHQDRIYVYKFFFRNSGEGTERAQSSWSYWEFSGADEVLQVLAIRETLYCLVRYGTKVYLEKISVMDRMQEPQAGSPYPLLLDRRVSTTTETPSGMRVSAGSYDANTKKTTWTLPYTIAAKTEAWSGFGTNTNGGVLLGSATSGTTIVADGNWSSSPIYFGESYTFRYRFTRFKLYKEIGGGKAAANVERTQVRHAKLRYHESHYFEIHVLPEGRDTGIYKFDGTTLGSRNSLLGSALPDGWTQDDERFFEGVFNIPIMSRGERCMVEIHNDTPHPCKFSTCEWVALVTGKASAIR